MKQSGLWLVIGGILGMIFFVATDPRVSPQWLKEIGWSENPVDAGAQSMIGTVIGLVGSFLVFVIGLWLLRRRAI